VPWTTIQLNQAIALAQTGNRVVRRRHAPAALGQLDECTFKFMSPQGDIMCVTNQ
jgi:hypothetical protein